MHATRGRLVLCATPIGNLEDITQRAVRILGEADVIACEDTRRTRKLLSHLGIKATGLAVYNDANEARSAAKLVTAIAGGRMVVLVTDAGMPGLSDPGYRLVAACIEKGLPVEVVPGPNAALSALVVSGIFPGRFVFEGFLPRRSSDRRRHLHELAGEERTLIFYESPHRIDDMLADVLDVLGDRPAALARELTKMHEEVRRAPLSELVAGVAADPPRGEIVVVVQGAVGRHRPEASADELADAARRLMADGVPRAEALKDVAQTFAVAKRKVFDALLEG